MVCSWGCLTPCSALPSPPNSLLLPPPPLPQVVACRGTVDVLVATPARLAELVGRKAVRLGRVTALVRGREYVCEGDGGWQAGRAELVWAWPGLCSWRPCHWAPPGATEGG
jgi:hypothetical protein